MLRLFVAFFTAPVLLGGCVTVPATSGPAQTQRGPSTSLGQGVVSAADPRAAEAGAQILRRGGSATDAAIAVMLALTVVEPQSSGIGGGGFLVRAKDTGEVDTFDGRETAPAAAAPDWFLGPDGQPLPFPQAVLSGLSVGVPGNIRLAAEAHQGHGKLPWAELFGPAVALARDGFTISERFREFLENSANRAGKEEAGRALFYDAAGQPLPQGTLVRNPALAATLERIAGEGAEAFYTGPQAQALASHVAAATPKPAGMTAADVASYQAKERPAVCGEYRRYRICGMGPPSSGATTVFAILKQLERFDLGALGPQSATAWHLFAESQRLAYADREKYLADADFIQVPVAGLMEPDYLAARGSLITQNARLGQVAAGQPAGVTTAWRLGTGPAENGTSHFAIADGEGETVSYTSTIEGSFGSGLMFGGFYLNNELTDFSFVPAEEGSPVANRIEGGKRPRSSMAPTVVFDPQGRLVLAIGAAGGSTIPVQVAKALMGVIDFGLDAQSAIALPILYAPGDTATVEPGSALLALKPQLEALGHRVSERRLPLKANAVQFTNGRWVGAADPRSEGAAVGE
jgi:gamma-glutamyltranspeptidase/glutathione hydrolase